MAMNHRSQPLRPQRAHQPTPAPSMDVNVWGATNKGRQREGNEDAIYPRSDSDSFEPNPHLLAQKGQLLVVADGVGGAQAGSEASHWAIRVAVERYYDASGPDLGEDLRAAVEVANTSLHQYLQSTGTRQAGCTMTAAVIHGNMLYVANVGDSRTYLLRNEQITQLTRDHTLTQQKIDHGIIGPEQAKSDPDSNVLTRSMGANPTVQVDLFPPLQLAQGDVVLLCSDGLTDMLADADIARVVGTHPPKRASQRLIDAANKQGGIDNISVVLARVGGKPAAADGGGLLGAFLEMSQQQRLIIGGLIGLVIVTFMVIMAVISYSVNRQDNDLSTPTPAPTTVTVPTQTATPAPTTAPVVVEPTTEQPVSQETPTAPAATSTPKPTATATLTPVPDDDGDGVFNQNDDCPQVPGLPEFRGCPDQDQDGFPEPPDACPGVPGSFDGCPDTDGDGIPDHQDVCPDYPGSEQYNGCPPPTSKPKPESPR
jgi:serine/threonine protein phosphatase PrpC